MQEVTIPYRYSKEEVDEKKDQLPELLTQRAQVQENKKEANKQFKDELDTLDGQIASIVKALRFGVEERTIRCEIIPDYDKKEMRFMVPGRMDPVYTRPMTQEERAIIPIPFPKQQEA